MARCAGSGPFRCDTAGTAASRGGVAPAHDRSPKAIQKRLERLGLPQRS